MKYAVLGASALAMAAASANAGGIDRSGQSIDMIFKDGTYAEFSFGSVSPEVSGKTNSDPTLGVGAGIASGDMAAGYLSYGAAVKHDYNDRMSVALIFDQPFGANVEYDTGTGYYAQGSTADLRANAFTALARYKFTPRMSVHGGVRYQTLEGQAQVNNFQDLSTVSPLPLPPGFTQQILNYDGELKKAAGWGYVLGAAYEIPDIALRLALTYNSKITTDHDSTETGNFDFPATAFSSTSTTTIETPQSVNLTFQSGVAKDTLVFGGVRWVNWSDFDITPTQYEAITGGSLVSYDDDTFSYSLGVGRRFTDELAGSISIGFEPQSGGISSNLGPTDGNWSLGIGGSYTMNNVEVSLGARYIWVGDAETQNAFASPAASFEGNDALGVGMKIGLTF
ncbi:OmpP1/FadL family transporter [Roseivivax sp. CAU 1753]